MPRRAAGLTAAKVRAAAPGVHVDGDGLRLLVRPNGARFWVLRFTVGGRSREMGLGRAGSGTAAVPLAEARQRAAEAHRLLRDGRDPLAVRDAAEQAERAEREASTARAITFRKAATEYIQANKAAWKNGKHAAQWEATLTSYAYPRMGDKPVAEVSTEDVLTVLQPIWTTKAETATRLRGRIEAVLDFARVRGWRPDGPNPAQWRGHLALTLPARSKVAAVEHHAALPWRDVRAFMVDLIEQDGMGARALEFAILTAARSGEVRGATWGEINLKARVWTIPAGRMKASREHRVPLSSGALAVLTEAAKHRPASGDGFVFPGATAARPLSDMTLTAVLRRMGRGDVTAHGFRSTFRDWAGEATHHPREVIEAALAHRLKDKAEAAYARGDLFEKRRRLMEDWSVFCCGGES